MRQILSIFLLSVISFMSSAQTFHAIIFSNMKESEQRSADRTEEMNNMRTFCQNLANTLSYKQDIRCHSDNEFTSTQFLSDLNSMSVGPDDIVVLFYNGHGCNWDDDDWPHMCFKDKQYWQTTAYDKLLEKCGNAKLLLCIACCCNMDSRGRNYGLDYDYSFDPNKVRTLFLGFRGKRKVITSSSIRGQYSYSWTSGKRIGSIYGISLREAVNDVVRPNSSLNPTWETVFSLAKTKTLNYTNQKQCPQFKIQDVATKLSPRAQRILNELQGTSSSEKEVVKSKVLTTSLKKNVSVGEIPSLVITVDFNINNLSTDGGRIVAFLESPKGIGVKDTNGRYCTSDGKVSVGKDFGTRQKSASFKDFQLVIPMDELHITDNTKDYFIRVGVYDYKTQRYIAFGNYVVLLQ